MTTTKPIRPKLNHLSSRTAKAIRAELGKRRFIGAQMSNVLFNLHQRQRDTADGELFDSLRRQWDAIPRFDQPKKEN